MVKTQSFADPLPVYIPLKTKYLDRPLRLSIEVVAYPKANTFGNYFLLFFTGFMGL